MAAPSASRMNDNDHNPWERKREKQPPNIDEILLKYSRQVMTGGPGSGAKGNIFMLGFFVLILAVFWFFSGFYTVRPAEEGVLLRFGRFVERVDPGLHWMARGINKVYVVDTNRIETWNYSAEMLTEDENYAKVALSVFYRVGNPEDYLFRVADPVTSLENAVSSALRQVIGHTSLEAILTTGKEQARANVEALVNEILDDYKTGIVVTDVKMQEATVPATVIKAFDNVITAREEKAAKISQGERYVKDIMPKAVGKAQRSIEEAKAYQEQVIFNAKADVAKFLALLPEYKKDAALMKERIYLDTMQNALSRLKKVYVHDGNAMLLMPAGMEASLPTVTMADKMVKNSENRKA